MPTELPTGNNISAPEPSTPSRPTGQPTHDGGSFHIARVAGIPIRLHVTFFLLLAWIVLQKVGDNQGGWKGPLFVMALFGCVVLHELGHALVAQRYGIRTRSITLYPIGGIASLETLPRPRQELWIALAGPAVNVVIAGALYAALRLTGQPAHFTLIIDSKAGFMTQLMSANLILAVFNMLPAFPMDGGRVLRSLIARFTDETSATTIAARIGQLMAVLFGLYGLFNDNFILVIVAMFVWLGAGQEAAYYQTRSLLTGHRVREAMIREFHTLSVGNTLREAADALLAGSQQDFPIVHGGDIVGVLSRSALMRGMAAEGPDAYVAGAMDREFVQVLPEDDLETILGQAAQSGPILVMEGGVPTVSALVGMLTQENLLEFLTLTQIRNRQAR
jgi:Zn-dependent protease/CBS domain-containing protein